ncbi:hypothetical protein CL618_00735 [archaeon]|nr:hypothetical protein [archaeon]|tara:strand:+ start:1007 stop:1360 length:354 start_codon:yes stop_codon:yes gene_type:complete
MEDLTARVQKYPLDIMVRYEPRVDGPYYSTPQVLQYLKSVEQLTTQPTPYFIDHTKQKIQVIGRRQEDYDEDYTERIERIKRTTKEQRKEIIDKTKKPENKRTKRKTRDNKRHKLEN